MYYKFPCKSKTPKKPEYLPEKIVRASKEKKIYWFEFETT
jgi:hypothetical protein